ncbi:unnamed protein product, partial [Ostreobium quekettii]
VCGSPAKVEWFPWSAATQGAYSMTFLSIHEQVLAEWCSFPDRSTGVGQLIDSYLAGAQNSEDDVIHLLFAANRLEKRQELIVKLQGGTTLVCDRYAYSGAAFTLAKGSPGLDLAWCKSVEHGLLPAPDVVFFLKAPADVAAGRGGFGNERYEVLEFQKKVADWYMRLSKTEGWTELDATKSIDAVHEEILKATAQAVDACKSGRPLGLLWQEGEVQSLKSSRNEAEIGGKEDK